MSKRVAKAEETDGSRSLEERVDEVRKRRIAVVGG